MWIIEYFIKYYNKIFVSFTNKTLNLPKNILSGGVNATSQLNAIKEFLELSEIKKTIFLAPKIDYEPEIKKAIKQSKSDLSKKLSLSFSFHPAFVLGFTLGFACMLGDMTGSYVKRRQGLKREGEVSSKAPLLDTLPFAIFIFLAAAIFFNDQVMMHSDLTSQIIEWS